MNEGSIETRTSRVTAVVLALAFSLALQINYAMLISPRFQRLNFPAFDASFSVRLACLLLSLLPAIVWLPTRLRRPSDYAQWVFYVVLVIPTGALVAWTVQGIGDRALLPVLGLVAGSFAISAVTSIGGVVLPTPGFTRLSSGGLIALLLVASVVNIGYLARTTGLAFRPSLFLGDVYSVRWDALDTVFVTTGGSYILGWQSRVIGPTLLAFGLLRRSRSLVAIAILNQVVLFSITAQKSMIFVMPLMAFGWIVSSEMFRRRPVTAFLGGGFALVTIGGLLDAGGISLWFNSILVRRFLALPAILTGNYFEYFSETPKLGFPGSPLGFNLEQTSTVPAPLVIGELLYSDSRAYANANFVADGFANGGWFGVFLELVLVCLALAAFDFASKGLDFRTRLLLCIVPIWSLTESAAPITLVTHGFVLAILIAFVTPRPEPTAEPEPAVAERADYETAPEESMPGPALFGS